jgi:hypothetical protein
MLRLIGADEQSGQFGMTMRLGYNVEKKTLAYTRRNGSRIRELEVSAAARDCGKPKGEAMRVLESNFLCAWQALRSNEKQKWGNRAG